MIATSYNLFFVALSVIVAIFASFVALDIGERTRAIWQWAIIAGLCLGCGIWSMHFIAMLALQMPMPVSYDIPLTITSLGIATLASSIGFVLARTRLWAAGLIMGAGIAAMHYTGMAAMRMAATIQYNPWLVTASVGIAITASTAALWLFRKKTSLRLIASATMGLAIAGMHYTGMAAASFIGMADYRHGGIEPLDLAAGISGSTLAILGIALATSMLTNRS